MRGISQAREGNERGKGNPYGDVERACRHWNITPEEYLSCPECYPLPPRGTGLSTNGEDGIGVGLACLFAGLATAMVVVVWKATKK